MRVGPHVIAVVQRPRWWRRHWQAHLWRYWSERRMRDDRTGRKVRPETLTADTRTELIDAISATAKAWTDHCAIEYRGDA